MSMASTCNLYPHIDLSNPDSSSNPPLSNPNHQPLYPSLNMSESDLDYQNANSNPVEDTLITIPGAVVHLIDHHYSVELATGDFSIRRIRQADTILAILACVSHDLQWPLIKEESIVKLDASHYFFSLPDHHHLLNYGLTFASKGQESLLKELDSIFDSLGTFSVKNVEDDIGFSPQISPQEFQSDENKRVQMERICGAYWTTLAPNVEDYSGVAAKLIASGSAHLIKGILWCGDVAVDRLNWGHEVLKNRIDPSQHKEIDNNTLKRIQRVKRMTKMTKQVATGVLSGVVKVSGFFTGSVANSKVGKKFFSLLPGEMVLASLDGFNRICDAIEVAGKNVMSTTSTVTTGLVTHKYGEEAGKVTHEGMGAAGHAIGTAWTVFKIRKALNPKSVLKPTTIAKSAAKVGVKAAADEYKSKKSAK